MKQADIAYVALALVPGIGRVRLHTLLSSFDSAEAVLSASQRALERVPGIGRAAATAIHDASPRDGERALATAEAMGASVLLPTSDGFPDTLRHVPDAPALLFALGDVALLSRPAVAIVGSRDHTRYGAEVCTHLAGGVARAGVAVISGLARGLDAIAHRAALDNDGATVGVLGNGLGVVYPAANRDLYDRVASSGCLLSEHPPGERPNAGSFPRRNRLISGLAQVTVVVEARERSGALITADCALSQGRELMAVPGPVTSPLSTGCNRLIQQGAKPALGLRDVLEECGMTYADAPATRLPNDLSDVERQTLDVMSLGVDQIDEIATRLDLPAAEALATLTSLEIRGLVVQEPGKLFRIVPSQVQPENPLVL